MSMKKEVLTAITAVMLATVPLAPAVNAATTSKNNGMTAISQYVQPIFISSSSYFNLIDAAIIPTDQGQMVAYTLSVYNGGKQQLNMSDYWFRLNSSTGTSYPIKMSASDAQITKVAPKTKDIITVYAKIGENTKLSDLILKVVKFDFSSSNYEKAIGSFNLPKGYTNVVKAGSYKALYMDTTTLYSKVSSADLSKSTDNNFVTVNFVYNNIGKRETTLSNYKYYLVNSQGYTYEATPSSTGNLTIPAQTRDEFQVTASIPATLKTTDWKLVVTTQDGSSSGADSAATTLPIGEYELNFSTGTSTSVASDVFSYVTTEGSFQFKLLQVTREPWDSSDLLTARVRIRNTASNSASAPKVTGYFLFDNNQKMDFTTVQSINTLGLNANGFVDVDVYSKLPSNYNFTNVKLVINDKKSDTVTTKAGELTSTSAQAKIVSNPSNSSYSIAREDSSTVGSVSSVKLLNNITTKTLDVQMILNSKEQRTIDPVKLTGVFVNDEGQILKAQVQSGTGQIYPNNKALVDFTATVPNSYDTDNLRLIVGEGVTDSTYTTGTAVANAYVNPIMFTLPQQQLVGDKLKNLTVLPYNLTVNEFYPKVFGKRLELTLKYDLFKDDTFNVFPSDRKLVFAIEGKNTTDNTIYDFSDHTVEFGTDTETTLVPGTSQTITLTNDMNYDINQFYEYKVKVYEVNESGSKVLLAERPFYWYVNNDWTLENSQ